MRFAGIYSSVRSTCEFITMTS